MPQDKHRAAERRRLMEELLAQADADVARTRAANSTSEPGHTGPVDEKRTGTFLGSVLGVVILLALSFVLLATAMTIGRFTGADYDDATLRGTATVEACRRRGPVSLNGFGFYDRCTVRIVWNDGLSFRVVIDDPGFIKGEKPGETFQIGQNSGSRGSTSYSRPEVPDRDWVAWIGAFFGFLAVLPLLAVLGYLRETIKDAFRRRRTA
jgi:hypothetical protein